MALARGTSLARCLRAALVALPIAGDGLAAQVSTMRVAAPWVGTATDDYARLLQLTGVMPLSSRILRPAAAQEQWMPPDSAPWRAPWSARFHGSRDSSRLWLPGIDSARSARLAALLEVYDPQWQTTFNSAFPSGRNDGALWAGKGVSTQLTAGAQMRIGPLSARLAPTITWSANRPFALGPLVNPAPNTSAYADQWFSRKIDRPQRFGDASFARIDPGQSSIALSTRGARVGWSSENMWWGPGIDDALLMTNNAPGFNHIFLGTARPANVGIGKLEVLYTLGWVRQSGFWRTAADTFPTKRWLNAFAFVFEPRGSPGLYLGGARLFYAYQDWNPITIKELFTIVQQFEKNRLATAADPEGNDTRDQMATLWFRWVFPQVGFEVYGEYGRNDHAWDDRDVVLEPEHSRAYQVGFQKVYRAGDRLLRIRAEATDLARTTTILTRVVPTWYTHHRVQQGYTQDGQVIGAGIGPGSDAQTLSVDWFDRRGRVAVMMQRVRDDTDALLTVPPPGDARVRHDAYLRGGPRVTWFAGPVNIDIQYLLEYEYNRYTVIDNDVRNHHLDVRAELRLP